MEIINSETAVNFLSRNSLEAEKLYTNFFLNTLAPQIEALFASQTMVFLNKEEHLHRLYFISGNLKELEYLLTQLPNKRIICLEAVYEDYLDAELIKIIQKHFKYQTTFQRIFKPLLKDSSPQIFPNQVNAESIYKQMQQDFNPLLDHLPSLEQVKKWENNNTIITVHKEKLEAYLTYEPRGNQAQLLFMANYNGKASLSDLWQKIYQTMAYHQFESIYLWYNINNPRARKMYQIEQFINDNRYCDVYLHNTES